MDERENLIINKSDILVYEPFNKMYKNDASVSKSVFTSVLKYMYFKHNSRAFPFQKGMTAKETESYSLKHSGMDKKIIETDLYKSVEKIYIESMSDATDELIRGALGMLRNAHSIVNNLNTKIEIMNTNAETKVEEALSLLDSISKVSKSIPDYIQNFEKLLELKVKDKKNKRKIRGGEDWKPSMDGVGFGDESDGTGSPERID